MKLSTVLRTFGWVQNKFGNDYIGYCLLGGVSKVVNITKKAYPLDRLAQALGIKSYDSLPSYNDAPERTLEEILVKLDRYQL